MWCPVMDSDVDMEVWMGFGICVSATWMTDLWSESGHGDTARDKVSSLVTRSWILNTEEIRI